MHDDAVLSADPAGEFQAATVVVNVKEDRLSSVIGELHPVPIQVQHQRVGVRHVEAEIRGGIEERRV